jgi:hypothetical protein
MRATTYMFFAVTTFLLGEIAQSAQWEVGRDFPIVGWVSWGATIGFFLAAVTAWGSDRVARS